MQEIEEINEKMVDPDIDLFEKAKMNKQL